MSLEEEERPKDRIALNITDDEGNNLSDEFKASVDFDGRRGCPEDCDEDSKGVCQCNDIGMFDVGGQISNLFKNSYVGKLFDTSVLENWKFYEDPIFWIVAGITGLYLIGLLLVLTKWRDYCVVKEILKKKIKGRCNTFGTSFMVIMREVLSCFLFKGEII